MDFVIIILALPLFILALASVPYRRPAPRPLPAAQPLAAQHRPGGLPAVVWAVGHTVVGRIFPWLVVVGLVLAVVLFMRKVPGIDNGLRLVLLSRYGLLTALLLVGLVPLGLIAVRSLLGNLFVLKRPAQLFHVAWLAVLVGTMAVVMTRVVESNAWERYRVLPLNVPGWAHDVGREVAVLILALPVPYACLWCTRAARPSGSSFPFGRWLTWGVLGVLTGFFLVVVAIVVQQATLSANVQEQGLFPLSKLGTWLWELLGKPTTTALYPAGDTFARLFSYLEEENYHGYTRVTEGGGLRLARGHAQVLAGMGAVLLVYVVSYLTALSRRAAPGPRSPFTSLFLLLLLLLLVGFALQGLAFALDLYRVPVSVAVGLLSYALYQFSHTDHYFRLNPRRSGKPEAEPPAPVPELRDVARNWQLPQTSRDGAGNRRCKTLVVVTASGGGIQATAWTCRVLTGLHQRYGDDFTRSVGLISAVSGGSVGALYYLDRWRQTGSPLPSEDSAAWVNNLPAPGTLCERAMASSLEATAWGLAFPDLLRVVLPWAVPKTHDRGLWIEAAWRSRLTHPGARLTDWTEPVLEGTMPIPVFNATIVETGQRFLAAPVRGRVRPGTPPAFQARELLELYPDATPYAATAARLSATFPFVSPICRPLWERGAAWPEAVAYHYADGGYVDNEGMMTAIQWLEDLLDPAYLPEAVRSRAFEQVLFIRVMPFPAAVVKPAEGNEGWLYATVGPLEAIANVRTASQQERNQLLMQLFIDDAARRGVRVGQAVFTFESAAGIEPPLSWMLTEPQQQEIDRAWVAIDRAGAAGPLGDVDAFFVPRSL